MSLPTDPLAAVALWAGANLLITLVLALNVTRHRIRADVPVGSGSDAQLERAVRAHGNNAEYVPGAIVAFGLLALTGTSAVTIHCLGGALLLGRLLHAHGIQILGTVGPPPTRVAGNLFTWSIYAVSAVLLIVNALGAASA